MWHYQIQFFFRVLGGWLELSSVSNSQNALSDSVSLDDRLPITAFAHPTIATEWPVTSK